MAYAIVTVVAFFAGVFVEHWLMRRTVGSCAGCIALDGATCHCAGCPHWCD